MRTSITNTLPQVFKDQLQNLLKSRSETRSADSANAFTSKQCDQELQDLRLASLVESEISPLPFIQGIEEARKMALEVLQVPELQDMVCQAVDVTDSWGALLYFTRLRQELLKNEQPQAIKIKPKQADKLMTIVGTIVKLEAERQTDPTATNPPEQDGQRLYLISSSVLSLVNALMVRECSDPSQCFQRSELARQQFFKKMGDGNRVDQDSIERLYNDTLKQFDTILKETSMPSF